ncbi:formimidoylglutamase [Tamlana sp. s12]|uniref:formimidoylglutamase n=1 Tax=Tamlana sp. s12 TaxID=1630406 RepID=UPI0007FC06C4|nr:formimidoylglutamase [Tamlana sp. s12]OBQ54150.1 arginase [Tamlana sp. s12]QQY81332.1 formimidoylglutamase [Tamlana sp. s12]
MDKLVLFNTATRNKLLNKRLGESKFGQHIKMLPRVNNIYEQLLNLDVDFVIIGLPEDVGVFANYGKTGTSNTWESTLKVLLNIQSNAFTKAERVLVLGHLNFSPELETLEKLNGSKKKDILKARKLVETIDEYVSHLVYKIVLAGKKPIIIGGGHNNAYGNIKGASLALGHPINAINFDAHSDFRSEEGRHSGNGFSYASAEGFLNHYFVFGLHENYSSDQILKTLNDSKNIKYNTFEALEVRNELKFRKELKRAALFICEEPFGIEIDCDAIENIASSAMTPSGFSASKARQFLHKFAMHENAAYLHLCEADASKKKGALVGKLLTYLITDFIRAATK